MVSCLTQGRGPQGQEKAAKKKLEAAASARKELMCISIKDGGSRDRDIYPMSHGFGSSEDIPKGDLIKLGK